VTRITAIRAAAVVALIQGLMQAWTMLSAQPHDIAEKIVVATMKGSHLSFGGMSRTYWDIYSGYGLFASGTWVVEAILLWIVAGIAQTEKRGAAAILGLLIIANIAHAAACFVWFTPLPLLFDIAIAVLLLASAMKLRAVEA
jgi:hypothetical protein